ncbi:formate/nitrite transporter family protein [Natranaerofaba carboxydovora]|uniref:formate/nitrite transporter family protein n=1 Tax=Natranaerofaba carboxydovora TaxID=2742683 RepID=UPI001F1488F9|nr:formate/nitrite transporter family protein [Natranaerofaba carboxydovora]UMZ72720.1 putative formate transporter 1 [Natranaerofaba carboxydovora]
MEERLSVDILSPEAIARKAENVGVNKANYNIRTTITLGILAGAFIALASEFYLVAVFDAGFFSSFTRILGGLVFSLGLILVILTGAELFTGNTLLLIAFMTKKITIRKLLRNWGLVYFGNFIGAIGMAAIVFLSRQWEVGEGLLGAHAMYIAVNKVSMDFWEAFFSGILANSLVVLAIWISYSGRTATDKIIAVILPITAFVASGFEHSIANMFFIPFGIMVKSSPLVKEVFLSEFPEMALGIENLNWAGFILNNLVPVTLGNIIGGGVLVGLAYWFVYLHRVQ